MWSTFFSSSHEQAKSPKTIHVLTEEQRLKFSKVLLRVKTLPSENYTTNCNTVFEHAQPKEAILSICYLHNHKLMNKKNAQLLFDFMMKSEQPKDTAEKTCKFMKNPLLKHDGSEYEIKIQEFVHSLACTEETHHETHSLHDEEDTEGFVLI